MCIIQSIESSLWHFYFLSLEALETRSMGESGPKAGYRKSISPLTATDSVGVSFLQHSLGRWQSTAPHDVDSRSTEIAQS